MSEHDVEVLKRDVQKILNYLHNDEGTGEKGLVAQVKLLQKDFSSFVSSYKTEQEVKRAKTGLIGAIAGGIMTGLLWLAEHLFK